MTTSLPGTNMRSPAQNVGTQVPAGSLVGRNPGGGVNAASGSAQSIPIRSIQPVNTYKAPLKAGTGVTISNNTINSTGNQTITLTGYTTGSGATTIATTTNKVKGDTSGGGSAAGDVGAYLSVIVPAASEVNINSAANVASLPLTPGNWIVGGELWLDTFTGSATVSGAGLRAGITSSSAVIPTVPGDGVARAAGGLPTVPSSVTALAYPVGPAHVLISGNTTYFLVGNCTVSAGTAFGYGKLWALRVG